MNEWEIMYSEKSGDEERIIDGSMSINSGKKRRILIFETTEYEYDHLVCFSCCCLEEEETRNDSLLPKYDEKRE